MRIFILTALLVIGPWLGTAVAQQNNQPTTTTTRHGNVNNQFNRTFGPPGNSTQTINRPDGSRLERGPDGRITQYGPDGQRVTRKVCSTNANGMNPRCYYE